jgi:hypothetical protein
MDNKENKDNKTYIKRDFKVTERLFKDYGIKDTNISQALFEYLKSKNIDVKVYTNLDDFYQKAVFYTLLSIFRREDIKDKLFTNTVKEIVIKYHFVDQSITSYVKITTDNKIYIIDNNQFNNIINNRQNKYDEIDIV